MPVDPRTPVLVGAGIAQQRAEDPLAAGSASDLMAAAVENADVPDVVRRAGLVLATKGMWSYADPARLVADRINAQGARTVLADIGVLQTSVIAKAATAVANGDVDVAVVVGGEANHRAQRARRLGIELADPDASSSPDETLRPEGEIIARVEIERGLPVPVRQYAAMETALRHRRGQSVEEHRRELAARWARFAAVAAGNPDAWDRTGPTADEIAGDRMLAFPYTRRHASQWNVDQAAALVLCAAEAAPALGVARERWIFPVAVADSNAMVPLAARADPARSPAYEVGGRRLAEVSGTAAADADHLDLYSCFPVAVAIQADELGIDPARQLTVTGGMTFGGGPLNNYVFQAVAKMAEVLRQADSGATGLVTAVSAMLTKQGLSMWSNRPPAKPFSWEDVSDATRAATATYPVVDDHHGRAVIDAYTVLYEQETPSQGIAVVTTPDGTRTVATSEDGGLTKAMVVEEWCGRTVTVDGSTFYA